MAHQSIDHDEETKRDIIAKAAQAFIEIDKGRWESALSKENYISVSGVPHDISTSQCLDFFSQFGTVQDAVKTESRSSHWIVRYDNIFAANDAIEAIEPTICGKQVNITTDSSSSDTNAVIKFFRDNFFLEMKCATIVNFPYGILPSPQLDNFLSQFGHFEDYTILPYTTKSSLIHIKFSQVSTARELCEVFFQHGASPQGPLMFQSRPLKAYPGRFKPTIYQHMYDLRPVFTYQHSAGKVLIKYRRSETLCDLQASPHSTVYLPHAYHITLAQQQSIQQYKTTNPAQLRCIEFANLWCPGRFTPTSMEQAKSLLLDIIGQVKKLGRIEFHNMHPNGRAYFQLSSVLECALVFDFFNGKMFNGGPIIARMLAWEEFLDINPDSNDKK